MKRALAALSLFLSLLSSPVEALADPTPFAGYVVDAKSEPIAGATVSINGVSVLTTSRGAYELKVPVPEDGLYMLRVEAFGKAPVAKTYSEEQSREWVVLHDATVQLVDPKKENTVVDARSGATVTLAPDSLVDEQGLPPEGLVSVSLGFFNPARMPGDFTATNLQSEETFLETVGAIHVEVRDERGRRFDLAPGATAKAFIPVPRELEGAMPKCVFEGDCRLSMYRFEEGRWAEKPVAMDAGFGGTYFEMVGNSRGIATSGGMGASAIIGSTGLGMWNADIEKRNPACTIIRFLGYPPTCFSPYGNPVEPGVTLTRTLPGAGGLPVTSSGRVTSLMTYVVLYNIPANVLATFSISFPAGAAPECGNKTLVSSDPAPAPGYPSGFTIRTNTGNPWGGTGFPKAGGMPITSQLIAEKNHPCKSVVTYQYQW